jgi:hypothetical protein
MSIHEPTFLHHFDAAPEGTSAGGETRLSFKGTVI